MAKAVRMTKQKRVILDILRNTRIHPTADWIYEQARKSIPDISLGTVYRNLKMLKEMGQVVELNYGSTYSRYDANTEDHYHFVCKKCHRLFDLPVKVNEELNQMVREATGFDVMYHRLEFYGICDECKANGSQNEKQTESDTYTK